MRLEEFDQLGCRGAVRLRVLLSHLLVGVGPTQTVCELAEQGVQLDAVRGGLWHSGLDAAPVQHRDLCLRDGLGSQGIGQFGRQWNTGYQLGIPEQVVSREERVGLAPAELRLQPVHPR